MDDARTLGDYQILKKIGQGALGTVFLAEHRFMKRQYMLKVLPDELSQDRAFVQRFEELVGTLASLDHPNIVKIHNVSSANGLYFLVSDCVVDEMGETTNLAQYLAGHNGQIPADEAYQVIQQVAQALDYAHGKTVGGKPLSHRGLKLNNILIERGGSDICVRLCDFGLSVVVGEGAVLSKTYRVVAESLALGPQLLDSQDKDKYPNPPVDSSKLSAIHQSFLQGFRFLAPEQREIGRVDEIGVAADVYACGVLAYHLLTRRWPEGFFAMPSQAADGRAWTAFLQTTLQAEAAQRPTSLVPLLPTLQQAGQAAPPAPTQHQPASIPAPEVSTPEVTSPYMQDAPIPAPAPAPVPEPQMAAAVASEPAVKPQAVTPAPSPALEPLLTAPTLERPQPDPDPAVALQVDSTVKHYQPEKPEVRNIEPIRTEMVVIEGGSFDRGSRDGNRDEMPPHAIDLHSFAMDIHPVTNEQFARFLEVMGGEKDYNHLDLIKIKESRLKRSGGRLSIESGYAKHPVVGVTWYGAVAYAKWVGKRLPTEAEWEVAACAPQERTPYPTGQDIEKSEANFFSADTTTVMSYPANDRGLYDMAGNVYEWCQDWYGYNYYEESVLEPDNPKGPLQGVYRVLRGGCWKSLKEDLRCSRRHRNNPGTANSTYGFRCASDVSNL